MVSQCLIFCALIAASIASFSQAQIRGPKGATRALQTQWEPMAINGTEIHVGGFAGELKTFVLGGEDLPSNGEQYFDIKAFSTVDPAFKGDITYNGPLKSVKFETWQNDVQLKTTIKSSFHYKSLKKPASGWYKLTLTPYTETFAMGEAGIPMTVEFGFDGASPPEGPTTSTPSTAAPTFSPTAAPPSGAPTFSPSGTHSNPPMAAPTSAPTSAPTKSPVPDLTSAPTTDPVAAPTVVPTDSPRTTPSDSPSSSPIRLARITPGPTIVSSTDSSAAGAAILRVTCGTSEAYTDTSSNVWIPDEPFTNNGVQKSYLGEIAGTSELGLFQTWREENGAENLFYRIPVSQEGELIIHLYFMERSYGQAGQREMDVYVEGSLILDNYDVLVEAGGRRKAVVVEFPVIVVGQMLSLRLSSRRGLSVISGLAIFESKARGPSYSPASPTAAPIFTIAPTDRSPTLMKPTGAAVLRITCGTSDDYIDTEGNLWISDDAYTDIGVHKEYEGDVASTSEQGLFQTWREENEQNPSNLFYTVPLEDGDYKVKLYLMEPEHNEAGLREIDFVIEGNLALNNYDIWAEAGGSKTAVIVEIPVRAMGGRLSLRLSSRKGLNVLCGFAIYESDALGSHTPTTSPAVTPTTLPTVTTTTSLTRAPEGRNAAVRITCGTSEAYTDAKGNVWMPDEAFTYNGVQKSYAGEVSGTAEQGLFQTWREEDGAENLFFKIPVSQEGEHIVQLFFMEPDHNDAGLRLMDIFLEGTLVAGDWDVWSEAGGTLVASVLTAPVTVSGATMALRLTSVKGKSILTAIAIVKG